MDLDEAMAVLAALEQGDLSSNVKGDYQGQLKDFKDTVNGTIRKLNRVFPARLPDFVRAA